MLTEQIQIVSALCRFNIIRAETVGIALLVVIMSIGIGVDAKGSVKSHIAVVPAGDIQLFQIAVTVQIGEEGAVHGQFHYIGLGDCHVFLVKQLGVLCKRHGSRLSAVSGFGKLSVGKIEGHAVVIQRPADVLMGGIGKIGFHRVVSIKIARPHMAVQLFEHRLCQFIVHFHHIVQCQNLSGLGVIGGAVHPAEILDPAVVGIRIRQEAHRHAVRPAHLDVQGGNPGKHLFARPGQILPDGNAKVVKLLFHGSFCHSCGLLQHFCQLGIFCGILVPQHHAGILASHQQAVILPVIETAALLLQGKHAHRVRIVRLCRGLCFRTRRLISFGCACIRRRCRGGVGGCRGRLRHMRLRQLCLPTAGFVSAGTQAQQQAACQQKGRPFVPFLHGYHPFILLTPRGLLPPEPECRPGTGCR